MSPDLSRRPLKTLDRVISKAGLGSRTEALEQLRCGVTLRGGPIVIGKLEMGKSRKLTGAEVRELTQHTIGPHRAMK